MCLLSRDIDRRYRTVGLDLIREEGVEAVYRTKEDASVTGLDAGIRLELFADQSVVACETLAVEVRNRRFGV